MSNFIVPNTFVPGTKAKAQEVNENFIAVQDELNRKVEKEGDPTQPLVVGDAVENNQAATKGQLDTSISNLKNYTESSFAPFLIKSGNVDVDGNADIIAYENGVVSFKVDDGTLYAPIVAIPANLQPSFTLTELNSIDLSSYSNGVYNIFIKSDGTAYALNNVISTQKTPPSSPSLNAIFVDISKNPLMVKKYNGETWETFNDVYLGNVTLSSGAITGAKTCKFNDNGLNVNRANQAVIVESYESGYSGYVLYSNGYCEQWGLSTSVTDGLVISLLKSYHSVGYTVQFNTATSANNTTYDIKLSSASGAKTIQSFKILKRDSVGQSLYWFTGGYTNY